MVVNILTLVSSLFLFTFFGESEFQVWTCIDTSSDTSTILQQSCPRTSTDDEGDLPAP